MTGELDGIRVLVIDDTDVDREFVSRILAREDAAVEPVSSVADALAAFARRAPDVVVCDYLFGPGEPTSNTFIDRLTRASHDPGDRVPVILLTEFDRDVSPRLLLEAGFDEVCGKPVPAEHLVRVVARLTKRRGAGSKKYVG